jgi:hypothetical protein
VNDLIRFAHYDLRIFSKYGVRIHTVVLSPASSKLDSLIIDTGCLHYAVTHQIIKGRNADEVLERTHNEIAYGNPVNELELIFVPLMESRLPVQDLLLETIKLEKQIKDENLRNKVIALTMVMSNRLVEADLLERIWEEMKMLKILKYAEDKGKEQGIVIGIEQGIERGIEQGIEQGKEQGIVIGIEQGIERGIEQGKEQGIVIGIEQGIEKGLEKGFEKGRIEEKRVLIERLLVKKFGPLPKDTLDRIQNMDGVILDLLSFEILDFQSIDDLVHFVNKMNP